jgi:hypothetical protein
MKALTSYIQHELKPPLHNNPGLAMVIEDVQNHRFQMLQDAQGLFSIFCVRTQVASEIVHRAVEDCN